MFNYVLTIIPVNYSHLQICTTSKDFNIIGMRSLKLCMTMQKMHVPCRMDSHTYLILGFGDLKGIGNIMNTIKVLTFTNMLILLFYIFQIIVAHHMHHIPSVECFLDIRGLDAMENGSYYHNRFRYR